MNRIGKYALGLVVATLVAAPVGLGATQQMAKYSLEDRVEFSLQTDNLLKKYNLDADVDDMGVVTLTGDVATAAQKTHAANVAKVDGVAKVVNEIDIDPDEDATLAERAKKGLNRAGEEITDAWITTKVHWFFIGEDLLEGSDINVDTNDHVVTLKGTVGSDAAKKRAVALTNNVDGVSRVVDQLTVKVN
jgi:osmotically-inducible protein OsmY